VLGIAVPTHGQDRATAAAAWEAPRTAYGHPDLQGNWTNATITTIQRPDGLRLVLTPEQVAEMEGQLAATFEEGAAPSDPDREAPPDGGVFTGDPLFDAASGGTGGYNTFFIDPGDRVAIYNGEPRGSLVVDPPDGKIPALTPYAMQRWGEVQGRTAQMGEFANPENRPLGERCLLSFGSNAGPPMVPNYFYNNNYTIVQTATEIAIMTEMVHDVRIIRLGEPKRLPAHVRPWLGDSWGHWDGDTLVVETTNLPEKQRMGSGYSFPGGSADMKVTERFTRVSAETINYEFTVEDPTWYEQSWSGQVPFQRFDDTVYEYACHEGNYSLFNVLSGARDEERRAAEAEEGDSR
jgi:hypothetical protein